MDRICRVIKDVCWKSKIIKKGVQFIIKKALFIETKMIHFFIRLSELINKEFQLRNLINLYYDDFYLRRDFSKSISEILNGKLIHLDVGARGGPLEVIQKYSKFIEIILCESEKKEANKLRQEGYKIIDKILYKASEEIIFFETERPAASSIYKSLGPYMDFYNPDPVYLDTYKIIKETKVKSSTISKELMRLQVSELDFLKLDTQGSEIDVLMGLGNYRPLIMQVEIEYLPLYHDIPNAYQVCQYLFELGYIPFSLPSHHARTLCPTWGDGLFMPSWVNPKGIKLIQAREEKYIALMLMFGQIKILKFVNQKIKMKNQEFIESLNV